MCGEKMKNRCELIVVGVDILPGYSPGSTNKQPHYAAVFMKDEKVIDSYEDVSFARLLRLVWEYRPQILAIDNVFELSETTKGLVRLVSILPPDIKIVQVTGWGPSAVNIKTVAKNMGIDVRGKLDPLKTAYLSALIASRGGGFTLKLLEEKTRIIVSKGRKVGHGGMSYDRYRRSIRAGILAVTKEIKKILDRHGFDYDVTFKKSKGGLEKSVFTVYAPRSKLYGLIKPFRNKSVRLTIRPIYSNRVYFETTSKTSQRKGLILGVDPGIYTGIAVMDLDGVPLLTYSSKNLDRGEILSMVSQLGTVVIVATDVPQPPELVKKIAASLNAEIYTPPHELSSDEKQELVNRLVKKYPWIEITDTHERDAMAAAYKTYLSIADKLRQLESKLADMDILLNIDELKIKVAKGKSIAEALEDELEKILSTTLETEEERSSPIPNNKENNDTTQIIEEDVDEKLEKLRNKIRILEAEKQRLLEKLEEKNRIIEELIIELKSLKYNVKAEDTYLRKIYILEQENRTLSQQLEELKRRIDEYRNKIRELERLIREIAFGNYIVVPRASTSALSNISKSLANFGKRDVRAVFIDTLLPIDNSSIEYLKQKGIAIITMRVSEDFYLQIRVPVISIEGSIKCVLLDDIVFVDKEVLRLIDEQWSKIIEIEEQEKYERILRLIEDYQRERKKKLGVTELKTLEF